MLLADEGLPNQKNRPPATPGFSFLTPSYIIRVLKDKKSLDRTFRGRDWRRGPALLNFGRIGSLTGYDI
jgi:hypothetical protein